MVNMTTRTSVPKETNRGWRGSKGHEYSCTLTRTLDSLDFSWWKMLLFPRWRGHFRNNQQLFDTNILTTATCLAVQGRKRSAKPCCGPLDEDSQMKSFTEGTGPVCTRPFLLLKGSGHEANWTLSNLSLLKINKSWLTSQPWPRTYKL